MHSLSRYLVIPTFVMRLIAQKKITHSDAMLLAVVSGLSKEDGFCYASNQYLGKQLGLSKNTVSNKLSRLLKLGLVDIEIIRDKQNVVIKRKIMVKFDVYPINEKEDTPPHKKMDTSPQESGIDNIDDNIDNITLTSNIEDKSSKEYGDSKINKFYSRFKEIYGYSLIENRKIANAIVRLLTKFNKSGQPKKGREWLEDDFEKNLDKFLFGLEVYFGKTIPRSTHTILKACQFYIANKGFGVLKQNKSYKKQSRYTSPQSTEPRTYTGDFSTPSDILF